MHNNHNIRFSIIIPTLNQCTKLKVCLSKLSELHFASDLFEVLVIDNGSIDETKKIFLLFKNRIKHINYFYCASPGLMAARHKGCYESKGDILCYIDDDSLVTKKWLCGLAEAFKDDRTVLVGGPCIPKYESTPPAWITYFWDKTDHGMINPYLSLLDFGKQTIQINPKYVFGCNYSIKKKIFLKFGGSNPDYLPEKYFQFQGDGESGLSKKIYNSNYKTIYTHKAKIYHLVPKSRLRIEYFCKRRYFNGIHSSFTDIRRTQGIYLNTLYLHKHIKVINRLLSSIKDQIRSSMPWHVRKIKIQLSRCFEKGYSFHQDAVKKDPKLLDWILRDNYLGDNGQLPY